MNNTEVCHSWANKTRETGQGSNLFFEGDIIYSYGHHFPMARHVEGKHGPFVLFTTRSYSISTTKHLSYAWRAASHLTLIRCDNVKADSHAEHVANLDAMLATARELAAKAERSRKNGDYVRAEALEIVENAQRYCHEFLPRRKVAVDLDTLREQGERLRQAQKRFERKQAAKRAKAEAERLKRWRNGENLSGYFQTMALRLSSDGHMVQTSQGASVPLDEALRLFELCRKCRDEKRALSAFSHKVGGYVPRQIDADGNAQIGCHDLPFVEMERLHSTLQG